jgi:hypothetical protein
MYLISFIKNLFSFTFYNKFVEIYNLFPCKTAYYVKRQNKFEKFTLCGLDMELEPELFKSRNRNRNYSFSKVGTGTGTITFQKSEPEPEP